jgi:hypothetical protein
VIREKRQTPLFKRKLEPIEVKTPKKISELLAEMLKKVFKAENSAKS